MRTDVITAEEHEGGVRGLPPQAEGRQAPHGSVVPEEQQGHCWESHHVLRDMGSWLLERQQVTATPGHLCRAAGCVPCDGKTTWHGGLSWACFVRPSVSSGRAVGPQLSLPCLPVGVWRWPRVAPTEPREGKTLTCLLGAQLSLHIPY